MATAPIFFDTDFNTELAALKSDFEARVGRAVLPADVEFQLLNAFASRITLFKIQAQQAAEQQLLEFATGLMIDYLADLLGVERTAALPATTTLRFNLTASPSSLVIPAGTRVQASDGTQVFAVDQDTLIAAGVVQIDTQATAVEAGAAGNGYLAGEISNIIDPLSFISTVQNTNTTAGGADQETDDQLRERVRLATAQFSTAGSEASYIFYTRSANPNIIDASAVVGPPGTVNVYPLLEDGSITPAQVLNQVENALTPETVRPLTDTVIVTAPVRVSYAIDCQLTLLDTADITNVEAEVRTALEAFAAAKRQVLGNDITEDELTREAMLTGVKSVVFAGWTDLSINATSFPFLSTISVTTVNVEPA